MPISKEEEQRLIEKHADRIQYNIDMGFMPEYKRIDYQADIVEYCKSRNLVAISIEDMYFCADHIEKNEIERVVSLLQKYLITYKSDYPKLEHRRFWDTNDDSLWTYADEMVVMNYCENQYRFFKDNKCYTFEYHLLKDIVDDLINGNIFKISDCFRGLAEYVEGI